MDDLLPLIKRKLKTMKKAFQPVVELAEAKAEHERMMPEPSEDEIPFRTDNEKNVAKR